jgi:hypothetical protein
MMKKLSNVQHDSGFGDALGINNTTNDTKLLRWQDQILSIWYTHHHRPATNAEIVFFRGLMQTSEECIKARLRQLFDEDEQCLIGKDSVQVESFMNGMCASFGSPDNTYQETPQSTTPVPSKYQATNHLHADGTYSPPYYDPLRTQNSNYQSCPLPLFSQALEFPR